MINKSKNSRPEDKLRITFNYSRVYKNLFDIYIKLSSKVYNYLSNLSYRYLFKADLKYTYLIVSLYPNNRYFFIFIIFDID